MLPYGNVSAYANEKGDIAWYVGFGEKIDFFTQFVGKNAYMEGTSGFAFIFNLDVSWRQFFRLQS